jgi:hypothetical protein
MPTPYVSLTTLNGEAVIEIEGMNKVVYHALLSPYGCRMAGAQLFKAGAASWLCSSSVDFPQEVQPGFTGDVRQLLQEGWQEQEQLAAAPRKAAIAKMLAHCSKTEFLDTLTPAERAEFDTIKNAYKV